VRFAAALGALLLAGCGSGGSDPIEPVPAATPDSADALMTEAERAAGNAQGRMGADTGSWNDSVEARR